MDKTEVCIFGEVLFDCFPDGRNVLGGAPFNVAWHLQAFGKTPRFISSVGQDHEGEMIRNAMRDWGMSETGLQIDPEHPTGKVVVSFDGGEPSYDIVTDSAWDHIARSQLPGGPVGLLYHGTLALRQQVNQTTLQALRQAEPETVFLDVNLRDPWWQQESALQYIAAADWVKINHVELNTLFPSEGTMETQAGDFLEHYGLTGLVLTCGEQGALALQKGGDIESIRPGDLAGPLVDTVGAGDAFASVFILGILEGWSLARRMRRAQDFASRIVQCRGATVNDMAFYQSVLDDWENQSQKQ